ncbi:MAG: sensor histidine kinase [Gammaproteobacteria bacterium]|nr:sensor histidine kinase [Gammaproteobacteria bacterium]
MNLLLKIHHKLLPKEANLSYTPYLSLAYLGIFLTNLYFYPPTNSELAIIMVGMVTFLVCYFRAYWCQGRQLVFCIVALSLIGVAMAEINWGASVFFVFSAVCCSFLNTKRNSLIALGCVILFIILYSVITDKSSYFWIPSILFSTIITLMTIHQVELDKTNQALKISQQQIQALATTAERERISRDLHDLLGHSLSVITLKAELAGKMIDKNIDIEQVRAEIKAVEQLSRETLAQVRGAVTGYNQATIAVELLQAKVATDAANIELISQLETLEMPQHIESQLALIIREAITNVVRHADTTKVWVNLTVNEQKLVLRIKDQGKITHHNTNAGINNMRERIDKLGGKMHLSTEPTTEFIFTLPNFGAGAS